MKIVRYTVGKKAEYGIWDGELVQSLADEPYHQLKGSNCYHKLSDLKLLPPCTPSKVVAVGLNYFSHAEEVKMPIPPEPLLFLKPSSSVIGPEDNIVYPPFSQRVDYEAELGVVIRTRAWQVSREEAMNYVLGYTFRSITSAA